jgi:hypothetical protein
MNNSEPIEITDLDMYGHAPLAWSRARIQLANWYGIQVSHVLCRPGQTARRMLPVAAVRLDDDLCIVSGEQTRKSKYLAVQQLAALYRNVVWPVDIDDAPGSFYEVDGRA